ARLGGVLTFRGADAATIDALELVAPDGVIVYSHPPGDAGRRISSERGPLLRTALAGQVAREVSRSRDRHRGADSDREQVLDVYVPVILEGTVVGVYE